MATASVLWMAPPAGSTMLAKPLRDIEPTLKGLLEKVTSKVAGVLASLPLSVTAPVPRAAL